LLKIIRSFVVIETLDTLSWSEVSFASTTVLYDAVTDCMLMHDFGDKYLKKRSLCWGVHKG